MLWAVRKRAPSTTTGPSADAAARPCMPIVRLSEERITTPAPRVATQKQASVQNPPRRLWEIDAVNVNAKPAIAKTTLVTQSTCDGTSASGLSSTNATGPAEAPSNQPY